MIKMAVYETCSRNDLGAVAFWLSNTCELLMAIKQEDAFVSGELQVLLSNCVEELFSALTEGVLGRIQPSIESLLRESMLFESNSAERHKIDPKSAVFNVQLIINTLDSLLLLLRECLMAPYIVNQIFSWLFQAISTRAFNLFLLDPSMFRWERGLIIKFNVARLSEWALINGFQMQFERHFKSLIQASLLLQTNKTSLAHLDYICDHCRNLNSVQLDHILMKYQPSADEAPVSQELLICVKARAMNDADLECQDDESYGYRVQLHRLPCVTTPFHLAGTFHLQTGLVCCSLFFLSLMIQSLQGDAKLIERIRGIIDQLLTEYQLRKEPVDLQQFSSKELDLSAWITAS
jgi:hypothetical protein